MSTSRFLSFLLTIAVAVSSALPAPAVAVTPAAGAKKLAATTGPIGDKWAVVIGLSKFADPRVPALKYPAKDAHDFYDYLVDPNGGKFRPDHVRILTDEQATKVNIMDTLGDSFLPHASQPEDLVVIYLSTHGSPAGADVNGVSYLVAYDTMVDKLFATGIEMKGLLQKIKERAHTNRIMLVLDSCYSGAGTGKGLVRHNVDASGVAQGLGSLVITSSAADQRAWESDDLKNSYFTRYFIDALKEGNVPVTRAFTSMKDKVQSAVLHDRGEMQTPVLAGNFTGPELILSVAPSVSRTAPPPVPLMELNSAGGGKSFANSIAEYVYHITEAHKAIDDRKWFEAQHELEAATKLCPTSVDAFLVYSDVLDAQGRYAEALEAAKRSVVNDENSSEGHEKLSRAYLRMEDGNEALRQIQKSLTLDPTNSLAENLLGFINEHQFNRVDVAEQQYRKALELNPINLRAMINLGQLLEKQHRDTQEVENLYRKATEADKDDPEAKLVLGRYLLKKNRVAEAKPELLKAADLDPSNPDVHSEMGNLLSTEPATYDAAEEQYRKAVTLAPKSAYAHFVLGRFLVDCRKRYDEGESELRTSLGLDPNLDACNVCLADLIISRHKAYDEADALYKKALSANPKNIYAHVGLAKIYSDLFKNYPQAQEELQKALAIDPSYSPAFLQLGLLLDTKVGRKEEAEQQYKKALTADPKNAYAHYYLGMLYLDRPKSKTSDDTLDQLKQAIAIDPSISLFHTKLGALLQDKYKNYKDAETQFRDAINANIADSEAHYRLGLLLIEKLSQRKAGERELRTAFEQNGQDPQILAAFQRFVSH